MLDRDRGPVGEHGHRLDVGIVEPAAALLRQVQVAPRLAADQQRHAENVVIGGWPAGKPYDGG
jgi:hypothetical protein